MLHTSFHTTVPQRDWGGGAGEKGGSREDGVCLLVGYANKEKRVTDLM